MGCLALGAGQLGIVWVCAAELGRNGLMAGAMALGEAAHCCEWHHSEMAGVGDAVYARKRPMIALQVERVADCWDELYPLAQAHQASTKSYRRHEPFNPDKTRYIQYNEMGYFHLITARDLGKLIGYFGIYATKSMHSQLNICTEDTLYIHPDYRQGRLALRIIRYVEKYLRNLLGETEILFSCEIDNKTGIQGLLGLLGYEPKIIQFSKHLSTSADSAATVADVGDHEPARSALTR